MDGEVYDQANTEWQAANLEAEERSVTFIRDALAKGCKEEDARALCWLAGIEWRLVEPQRQAA